MELNCNCGHTWLVHSGHAWRYRRARECPKCGNIGETTKAGLEQIRSRNEEVKTMRDLAHKRDQEHE